MKNVLQMITAVVFTCFSMLSCSTDEITSETDSMSSLQANTTKQQVDEITAADLYGEWNLVTMTSDVAVDFNGDGTASTNILSETSCFDNLSYGFQTDGIVIAHQPRFYFDSTTGIFSCETFGHYAAEYQLLDNQLNIKHSVDGQEFNETQSISLYREDGYDYLEITVTEAEFVSTYSINDPGTTIVSDIQEIHMTFRKQW